MKWEIERHIGRDKHKNRSNAAASSKTVKSYFISSTDKADLNVAACEGVWAFHTVKSNYSFRSSDCASKIFRECFEMLKFTCSRTKCESIVANVFAPIALDQLKKDLTEAKFVTLLTDASNHGNIKTLPIVVRFFLPNEGVRIRVLTFTSIQGETSQMIYDEIKKAYETFGIKEKVVAFCGDNANTNFGGLKRKGQRQSIF